MDPLPQRPTKRATFTKEERLCGQLRLKEVVTTGRSVVESPIKMIGKKMPLPGSTPVQVAFSVPRRYMKNAVDRNLVRRRMREAFRLNKEEPMARLQAAGDQYAWLFIYQAKQPIPYSSIESKITRSIGRWMNEHG
jgi:ribonuclease P protein component